MIASSPRRAGSFAGLPLAQPLIMGILNLTPDSFYDGGAIGGLGDSVAAGLRMVEQGAAIVDVGGESTRPGAAVVPPADEQRRILPAIELLARQGVVVSVDTRNASTMRRALAAGARIVNDVSALTHDPDSLDALAGSDASVILMHSRGTPADMNRRTDYQNVIAEVAQWLAARAHACREAGIAHGRIALDPGLGFAKTAEQSLALLDGIGSILAVGFPVLVGASRKSFLKRIGGGATPSDRLEASLAVAVRLARAGVHILRVHDVAETAQALLQAGLPGAKGA